MKQMKCTAMAIRDDVHSKQHSGRYVGEQLQSCYGYGLGGGGVFDGGLKEGARDCHEQLLMQHPVPITAQITKLQYLFRTSRSPCHDEFPVSLFPFLISLLRSVCMLKRCRYPNFCIKRKILRLRFPTKKEKKIYFIIQN